MLALYVIVGSPAELLSHPGPRCSGSSDPARAVTVLGEKMTAQPGRGTGGDLSRSVTTSCWGRHQRITQPKALNLLTKPPEATLSLIQLFPQGTGQQLPSDSLEVWDQVEGGWGAGAGGEMGSR